MSDARSLPVLVVRGATAFVFGLILLSANMSTTLVAVAFGTWALIDGLLAFAAGLRGRKGSWLRRALFVEGTISVAAGEAAISLAVGVSAGSAAFADSHRVVWALSLLIGIRALALGATQVIAVSPLFRKVKAGRSLSFSGASSLLFGAAFVTTPGRSREALVLLVAIYAMVTGALLAIVSAGKISQKARRIAA
jgi:uncharacterized membrane protein HdeD (DUF308 family)